MELHLDLQAPALLILPFDVNMESVYTQVKIVLSYKNSSATGELVLKSL